MVTGVWRMRASESRDRPLVVAAFAVTSLDSSHHWRLSEDLVVPNRQDGCFPQVHGSHVGHTSYPCGHSMAAALSLANLNLHRRACRSERGCRLRFASYRSRNSLTGNSRHRGALKSLTANTGKAPSRRLHLATGRMRDWRAPI